MSVEVVVPWRGGCLHRERAWRWVRARLPYPVQIGEGGEPWVKAEAVMAAIEVSDAEIVVLHDADVWHPHLERAVDAVSQGAPWAVPHKGVFRLDEQGTSALLAGAENFEALSLEQVPYAGVAGGGIVVAPREVLLEVPLDPRFVGWGQEDLSWGIALDTLAGHRWRGKGPLVHLFHPPQLRLNRRHGSSQGKALWNRYRLAADDPGAMRALIEETHVTPKPSQPNLLDRDPVGLRGGG